MKGNKKSVMNRVLSMILAVLMLVTSVPVDVHAAESSLKVANGQGEETDKIYVGEPIYVKAKSDIEGAWVGLYNKGDKEGAYWFYYYVSDSYDIYRNIYHSTAYSGYNQGTLLAAGEYDIVLYDADYGELLRKSIEIIEPESSQSALEVQATELSNVDNVVVKATSYNNQAWMAIYEGTKNPGENLSGQNYVSAWTYVAGINGAWYNFGPLSEGTYSVVMFTDGNYIVDKSVSITVSEAEVALITTDKTEYAFGEPIMVTSQYGNPYWVGLYKQSDANPTSAGPTSLFWLYATPGEAVNILSGEQQRQNDYVAGTYKVLLLDANYGIVGSVENITITAEETGRVTTPPTCEADGKIVVSYSDNTTKTITVEEDKTLGKLGHDYDADNDGKDDWVYSKPNKTHTKTCVNCNATDGCAECVAATVTDDCTWDEGVEIKPPTDTENGIKEYTCGVCGGKYTEPISMKTVVSEKVITPATCESEGTLRKYYNEDETEYIDVSIPKGSHDYDADDDGKDDWVHDKGKETHTKSCVYCTKDDGCAECNAALVTEKCNYTNSPVTDSSANKLTYTCEICNGKSSKDIITIEKTKYDYGEDINVVVNDDYVGRTEKDWIGLYLESDTPGTHDEQSFYWNYLNKLSLNGFNMIEPSNSALDDIKGSLYPYRADEYIGGKYIIYLFSNDGFDVIAKTEVFDIEAVKTEEKVTEATCEAEGETVIYFNDGTKDITKHDKLGHDYDADNDGKDDWVYNGEAAKTHTKTCQNEETKCNVNVRSVTENCTFGEPVISKKAEGTEAGEKTFTCSVCGGTYTEEYFDKVVTGTETIKEATCQEEGTLRTYYSDETYSDSAIRKLDCVWSEWTHITGTKTHEKVCKKDGTAEGHKENGNCTYSLTSTANGKFTYTCGVCKDSYSDVILSTDKTSYKFDEPIMVSFDYSTANDTWVGIYRKGDTPGVPYQEAFYWNYLRDLSSTFNMIDSANKPGNLSQQRWDQYVAGEYTIILFANGGYTPATSIDLTITKEETGRETTNPTCETDGKIVVSYSDGTTETITAETNASLKRTGHAYPEKWTFDKEHKKHTKVCENDKQHVLSGECTFEEEITKAPSDNELGEKAFTCSVCTGSYTEPYTDKEITGTEIIKKATCEENGTQRYYYEGGYFDVTIDMLGHKYGKEKHVEGTKTHSQTCEHDSDHVITDDCKYGTPVVDGKTVIYTCEECNGDYKTSVLTSDKVVYDVDDQILVTAFCENPGSWVGLYKKGEKYGEGAGTVFSMRWYYVKNDGTDRNGATIDISSSAYIGDRQDPIVAGDYYIVLFGDSGYNEITRIEISVVGDTSSTEYDIDINGTSYESGSKLEFLETDEIKVTISAEGSVGESWVGVYTNEMGIDTDFTDITSAYWQWIKDINGTTLDLKREMTLGYGDFSIVIFGDGGKSDPRKVVNFSIAQGENDSSIIKQPTCSNWGTRYVEYEDGTSAYVPIEPLGHDVKEWIFDKDRHSHSGICQRKNCGYEITRLCKFDDGVLIEQNPDGTGVILYTCSDCKGTYTEGYTEIPVDDTVVRIFGETRVETAMLVANRYKELLGVEKLDNIIIANGSNFADALAGSYLAKQKNAPILMYHGNNTDVLHKYINENLKSGGTVYILGGVNALPVEVETGLDGFYVKRLAGATRYETNIEILKEAGVTNQEILVCTGTGFADSLSASAVGKPILLVNSDTNELLDVQKEYLNSLSSDKYYIIGGENAVSENLEIAFRNYGATERLGGATRYETSVMVAERFFAMPDYVVLAYSMNFPDGLCGGSLAMAMNAPVILTATDNITEVKGYLENNKISAGTVLGGEGLISDEAVTEIFNMNEDNQIEVIK